MGSHRVGHDWSDLAVAAAVFKSCPTLCDPMNCCYPPGSSVHGILQQEYWSGLPCPPPGDLPDPEIESASPALAGRFFAAEPPGKPQITDKWRSISPSWQIYKSSILIWWTGRPSQAILCLPIYNLDMCRKVHLPSSWARIEFCPAWGPAKARLRSRKCDQWREGAWRTLDTDERWSDRTTQSPGPFYRFICAALGGTDEKFSMAVPDGHNTHLIKSSRGLVSVQYFLEKKEGRKERRAENRW